VGKCRGKRHKEDKGFENNITRKCQAYEMKFNRNVGKTAECFCIAFQLNKVRAEA